MRKQMAIAAGKWAKKASRLTGRGGTNIPGVVARKCDPGVLAHLANQVEHIILVTGTNGKTTTSQFVASILAASGEKVIHNAEGANLITGITSCFVDGATYGGKAPYTYAVVETDEATLSRVTKELKPDAIVFTNFFRDQLDRFGEIDMLLDRIMADIAPLDVKLVLNADDPFTHRLSSLGKETMYYGMNRDAFSFEQHEMTESKFCPTCGSEMQYDHIHYGQLGYYACSCGFSRPTPEVELTRLTSNGVITMTVGENDYPLSIGGTFNAGNALAALTVARMFAIEEPAIHTGLASYQSSNGRMQSFSINGTTHVMNLAKNPAGLNVTLSEALYGEGEKQIVMFLNDLDHDGRDVSWIWDGDIERLCSDRVSRIICSGLRAHDLAIRMKYAGIDPDKIVVTENKEEAIHQAVAYDKETFYIPNYTAMEAVRKTLTSLSTTHQEEKG